MLNVKLERYLNTFWRKDEAKSFASLSELENWIASGEKPLTRKLWARLGVSLRITAEEEAVIFGADETLSEKTIRKIILDGRFTPDGDSYVPEPAAEQFNEDYGTNHPVRDIGFEM